jgi:hypothetical protein
VFSLPGWLKALGWLAVVVMGVAVAALAWSSLSGDAAS